jgi:hypothetical protein
MNYSVSYEAIHNLRVGFSGYWLQQTTDDKVNGVNVAHSLERTVGLGAGIQYFSGGDTWVHLNAYKETNVRNRAQGYSVTLRLSRGIPSDGTSVDPPCRRVRLLEVDRRCSSKPLPTNREEPKMDTRKLRIAPITVGDGWIAGQGVGFRRNAVVREKRRAL